MPLKVELKPGEKVILGQAVITNGDSRARFILDGNAPLLREKDIMKPETADTPAKLIYLAVQVMYLDQDVEKHHQDYFKIVTELLAAAPSLAPEIANVNNNILTGGLYKALRAARALISKEEELLSHARTSRDTSLPVNGPEGHESP
ncbi:MAG: flagellar biosynthesis repressor FlbT [Pseudomonadota bacterium]